MVRQALAKYVEEVLGSTSEMIKPTFCSDGGVAEKKFSRVAKPRIFGPESEPCKSVLVISWQAVSSSCLIWAAVLVPE